MEKNFKFGIPEKITALYLLAFISVPIFYAPGESLPTILATMFIKNPVNIIFYLLPVAVYGFFKINKVLSEKARGFYLAAFSTVTVVGIALDISLSAGNFTGIFSLMILSVLLININDITAMFILVPGLFLSKLGVQFLLGVYIPVLLLLCIKTMMPKSAQEQKKSSFMFFAYLYVAVLAVFLFISRHITFTSTVYTNMLTAKNIIAIVFGSILLLCSAALIIVRTAKNIKAYSVIQIAALFIYAVYPIFFTVICCVYKITWSSIPTAFNAALMMYLAGNLQLDLTFGSSNVIPQNKIKPALIILGALLCAFAFR